MVVPFDAMVDTPVGFIGLVTDGDALTRVILAPPPDARHYLRPRNSLAKTAAEEILAYFSNPRHVFNVPVAAGGTVFQQRVHEELKRIPVGEMRTYGELAKLLDTSARAVGGACRANPCPIIIPCHRVVARGGGLGGFGGQRHGEWLAIKRGLLGLEDAYS